MFCDRCGTPVTEAQAYCSSCGKPMRGAPAASAPAAASSSRVARHVKVLGILWLLYSASQLLGGWFLGSIFSRFFRWGAPHYPFILGGILGSLGWLLAARGILGVIAGWGLLERHSWARVLTLVVAALSLLHFWQITGLALAIYTFWVLLPADSEREYRLLSRPA
jgi:hypothetical protein